MLSFPTFFKTLFLGIFLTLHLHSSASFDKVVIWGHKLHQHTHSYVHEAFFKAFSHMGFSTFWFDDNDDVQDFDFSNTLFLTEGQADKQIPLRDDCFYILHNCDGKYRGIPLENKIVLQVYTNDVLTRSNCIEIESCIFFDTPGNALYMPWAADLLPHEIELQKQTLKNLQKTDKIYWIGTIGGGEFGNIEQLNPFIDACRENQVQFIQKTRVSAAEHLDLVSHSYLAPAIVGEWQRKQGYIPCRIFKNISYGQMGATNSSRAYELFQERIIYNEDTYQLFYDCVEHALIAPENEIYELMDFVKDHHTYINRIKTIFTFFKSVNPSFDPPEYPN